MLFSQLMDFKLPIVLVLNMQDLAEAKGLKIDTAKLSEVLGISVVPITARKGKGIDKLIEVLVDKIEKTTFTFYPSNFFENSISNTIQQIFSMKPSFSLLLFLLLAPLALLAHGGTIKGLVVDAQTNTELPGATVTKAASTTPWSASYCKVKPSPDKSNWT
jgi:Fe2+ transport system protein B